MSEPLTASSGSDSVVAQRWTERFARFATANSSVTAFCAAEGIAKSGFFRWRAKLASSTQPTPTRQPNKRTPPKTTVVPMRVASVPVHSTIELVLPSGGVLRFPIDTSPELLLVIIRGLELHSC
jgi:hypothetical protein